MFDVKNPVSHFTFVRAIWTRLIVSEPHLYAIWVP